MKRLFALVVLCVVGGHSMLAGQVITVQAIAGYKNFLWGSEVNLFTRYFGAKNFVETTDLGIDPFKYFRARDLFANDSANVHLAFHNGKLIRTWINYDANEIPEQRVVNRFRQLTDYFTAKHGTVHKTHQPESELNDNIVAQKLRAGNFIWYKEWKDNMGKIWMQLANVGNRIVLYVFIDDIQIESMQGVQSGLNFR